MYVCMYVRGLSLEIPNKLDKFLTYLGAIGLCPLQHFSCIPLSVSPSFGSIPGMPFFLLVMRNSASEVSLISSPDSNRRPFSTDFSLVERKKSFKSFQQCLHGRQSLYWHQHGFVYDLHSAGRHEFGCNTIRVQMFSDNLMTCGFRNSSFLCYFMAGQTTIGMFHFPNFLDIILVSLCWRSFWTFIDLNWSSALFKTFVPPKGFCSTHGLAPNAWFDISKAFENLFPNLKQNCTETGCSWISPISNRRKLRPASRTRVYSNRHNTMPTHNRTIQFVAFPKETHC